MGLFGRKAPLEPPKASPKRRAPAPLSKERLEAQRIQMATKELNKLWGKMGDDERLQYVAQTVGFRIVHPPEKTLEQRVQEALMNNEEYISLMVRDQVDTIKAKRERSAEQILRDQIRMMAVEKIKNDPDLAAEAIRKEVTGMVGGIDRQDPVAATLATIKAIRELENEVGGGNGKSSEGGGSFWAQVLAAALPQLLTIFAPQLLAKLPAPNPLAIEQPAAGSSAASSDTSPITPPPAAAVLHKAASVTVEPTPADTNVLDLSAWEPYLDQDPTVFAHALLSQANMGDPKAVFACRTISLMPDAKSLLNLLANFKPKVAPEVASLIERLEGMPEWVTAVMSQIKAEWHDAG